MKRSTFQFKSVIKTEGRPNFRPAKSNGGYMVKSIDQRDTERKDWYPANWDELSSEVKQRDNYTCQCYKLLGGKPCGAYFPPPFSHLLHVHHIVPLPKGSNKKRNLITVTKVCHGRIHGRSLGKLSKKQKAIGGMRG